MSTKNKIEVSVLLSSRIFEISFSRDEKAAGEQEQFAAPTFPALEDFGKQS